MNRHCLLIISAFLIGCGQPTPLKQPTTVTAQQRQQIQPADPTAVNPSAAENARAQALKNILPETDANLELTMAANGGYAFVDIVKANEQLRASGLRFKLPDTVPTWAAELRAPDGRLTAGSVSLGDPLEVVSVVAYDQSEGPAKFPTDELAQVGDALLSPLNLADGRVAGLVRVPLYRDRGVDIDTSDFILFGEPVRQLTAAKEALIRSEFGGSPEVALVAVSADGQRYSPFDVRWVIIDQNQPGKVGLVPLGLPAFFTSRGEQLKAEGEPMSVVSSLTPVALQEAQQVQQRFAPANGLEQNGSK
jgi:hypothetical protein